MANLYLALKEKHEKEVHSFRMFFAFNEEQFDEGASELGVKHQELCGIGMGGVIRKSDAASFAEMFIRHDGELKSAMNDSETGDQFIFDMFNYELANHEYTYTYDLGPTLSAVGLTLEEVQLDERLANGLNKACEHQQESDN